MEITKEVQLFQLKRIQLISEQQSKQTSQFLQTQIINEMLGDLDLQIAQIDFEFDEIKEQQLCVDLSIEDYFKKIDDYPKSLKKLFDMGTKLLDAFDSFYSRWYLFQVEVQQKLYNFIYSNSQELMLSSLLSNMNLKQLEKILVQFQNLKEEYLNIRSNSFTLQVEIQALNQDLFHNSQIITQSCINQLEHIGIMDFNGVGNLIQNKNIFISEDIQNNQKQNVPEKVISPITSNNSPVRLAQDQYNFKNQVNSIKLKEKDKL